MNSAIAAVLAVLIAAPLITLVVIWDGYVLSVLWGWFLVPAFGLPALSIPMAIGLSAVATLLTTHGAKPDEDKWRVFLRPILGPAFLLLIGWIAKSYI